MRALLLLHANIKGVEVLLFVEFESAGVVQDDSLFAYFGEEVLAVA